MLLAIDFVSSKELDENFFMSLYYARNERTASTSKKTASLRTRPLRNPCEWTNVPVVHRDALRFAVSVEAAGVATAEVRNTAVKNGPGA